MNVRMIKRDGKLGVGVIGKIAYWIDGFMGTTVLEREKVKYRSLEQGYSYNKIRVYITMENK